MENQVSSKSIILNQGLYLGIVSILINLVVYALGNHLQPHWSVSILFFVALTGFIVMGMKQFKSGNGGFMSWGEAVKIGVGLTMISAVIVTIYNQIFMNFIEPDLVQQWIDAGLSSDQIETSKEMMEKFQGPIITSAAGLLVSAIFGFIVSAIAGAIMKESAEDQY
jgi:hypothetical protein